MWGEDRNERTVTIPVLITSRPAKGVTRSIAKSNTFALAGQRICETDERYPFEAEAPEGCLIVSACRPSALDFGSSSHITHRSSSSSVQPRSPTLPTGTSATSSRLSRCIARPPPPPSLVHDSAHAISPPLRVPKPPRYERRPASALLSLAKSKWVRRASDCGVGCRLLYSDYSLTT